MTMTPRARSAVAVAALLVAGLLAGCDDEEDPPEPIESSSEPTSSATSATTEPSPTGPVEPTLPRKAEGENQAGVEAFVTFYWEVVNYATKTGDVRLLRRLYQPSCTACEAGSNGIELIRERGGKTRGGNYRVLMLEPVESANGNWAVITRTRVGTQRTIGAGDLDGTFPGGKAKWLIGVARIQDSWSVTTLEHL